jgi:hypothetical protein
MIGHCNYQGLVNKNHNVRWKFYELIDLLRGAPAHGFLSIISNWSISFIIATSFLESLSRCAFSHSLRQPSGSVSMRGILELISGITPRTNDATLA